MEQIKFGIVGGGWRTEFYLRIARSLPEKFQVTGIVVRDPLQGQRIERDWGIPTYRDIDELFNNTTPSFVVLAVSRGVTPEFIRKLVKRDIPVLTETPPAADLDALIELNDEVGRNARVQVAEQYLYQPLHAARLSIIHSGLLGDISQTQVSVAHGYHGMSLIRRILGIQFEDVEIRAFSYTTPIIEGPNRKGAPEKEKTIDSKQVIALLQFGDKTAVYDFTGDQYFSWIRSPRLLVRGDKGEIHNGAIKYLQDFATPVQYDLKRVNAGEDGNLEGYYLKGIMAGERWAYRNPFIPASLTDDEIAIATCLDNMNSYVNGGPSFYSLAEASQDHYLAMMIEHATETGTIVKTNQQIWAQ
ncbi:Gfo/Idh/MocA family protein [Cohnella abietis]|uniref:Gfo/Idh/MocA-like oxidoreductase N-terminal domain-containing protein n=1 Tax=Cohnella abietis TaxID=2507935 RepID=A0A3T1DCM9_9BACL|nr:Gfo/Idh/MocA family oxidoreductase [Cohnella abietis]BBI35853.1 hypothetical protein KCTCHS21_52520 [Cohnella abietis]